MMDRVIHLLDYLATHPDGVTMFKAADMIFNVHSDASYLSEKKAKSRMGGYFFLGCMSEKNRDVFIKNTEISCMFSGRGRISCIILEHEGSQDSTLNARKNGPQTTSNTSTL